MFFKFTLSTINTFLKSSHINLNGNTKKVAKCESKSEKKNFFLVIFSAVFLFYFKRKKGFAFKFISSSYFSFTDYRLTKEKFCLPRMLLLKCLVDSRIIYDFR